MTLNELFWKTGKLSQKLFRFTETSLNDFAFENCKKLKKVLIPSNSQLEILGCKSFAYTKIISFFIPSNVSSINYAFFNCDKLQIVEIAENSKIGFIYADSFKYCGNIVLFVPCKSSNIVFNDTLPCSPFLKRNHAKTKLELED